MTLLNTKKNEEKSFIGSDTGSGNTEVEMSFRNIKWDELFFQDNGFCRADPIKLVFFANEEFLRFSLKSLVILLLMIFFYS